MKYEPLTFEIPELEGISRETINLHLGLYQGYVKHVNLIRKKIADYSNEPETNAYAIAEMRRRLGFEFGGMRNHEYYFASLEGGAKELSEQSDLRSALTKEFGSLETFLNRFKSVALTRGVGWAILYYDKKTDRLLIQWVDEQHLGHLTDTAMILALDMWEHSYLFDYIPSQKKEYVKAFFENLNWEVVEQNFTNAIK